MVPLGALGLLLCVRLCRGTGELRLVGGGRCAGRVEVKHDGEWGSVCVYDFDWDAQWARVACRQLGCGSVAKASPYAPFGQGTGRIWLQPFFCRGHEQKLEDCPHFGWGRHFCGHERDVGVTCVDAMELRLAAGGGPCAGRVEVKLRGQWGTVADDKWDMEDAEVVCRQLGCGSAGAAFPASARFSEVDSPINLALVDCTGDEATLWDCEIRGWGPYNGTHGFDTAVVCQGLARLVGGEGTCTGRLEVWRDRAWTGVCQDHVDIKVGRVVCRELGCGMALAVGRVEGGMGPLWEGGFECNGTEPLLSACTPRLPHGQGCSGYASIVCSPYTGFRLAGNSSGCTGRVEVEVEGTWGSLCAAGWNLPDAHVLCRHLDCGPAAAVPPGGSFGGGNGQLRRDALGCSGGERHPAECPVVTGLGETACPPGYTAAVNCSGITEPLRLVEGDSRCDGRLEVAASPGGWARVPAGLWDARGASVVCRHLGCGTPDEVNAVPGSGAAGLRELRCAGTEENLAQCNISATAAAPTSSPEEVAVVCSGSRRVRLVGSPGRCAGQVEVYGYGTWGTVCQDGWDVLDATVVCRHLGCGTALEAPGSDRFGPGTGPLWPGASGCAGTEASLWDCPSLAQGDCQRGGGAAAVCSGHLSLRLAGDADGCSGHLEVFHNGTWGGVCADGTSHATATVACRHLGCGDWGRLMAPLSGPPTPAWLAWVNCEEGSRSLWQCPSALWHLQHCGPDGDVYIDCHQDGDSTSGTPPPSPGIPTAETGSVAVVLCAVLGTLLCLALAALAVQTCRARRRGRGRAKDAVSDAVYEELDYTLAPEYQEVSERSGSLSEGSGSKLPYYTGDSAEESDPEAAPGSPTQHGPPDGYDDAAAEPEEFPVPGGVPEEGPCRSWEPPSGGSCPPPSPPGAGRDPPAQPPGDPDYDDVGVSARGTSL